MTNKCPKCGAALNDNAAFCTECGTKIQSDNTAANPVNNNFSRKCSHCGAALKDSDTFCTNCGMKVQNGSSSNNTGFSYTNNIPPNNSSIQPKSTTKNIFKGLRIALIAVAVIIILWAKFGGGDSGSSSSGTITVKAEEMADDYIRDQGSAEKKYKDKKVKITGQVASKTQFTNSQNYGVYIFTKESGGKTYYIILDMDSKHVDDVNKLHVGDFASAEGTCIGIVKQKDSTDIAIEIQADKLNK